MNDQPLAAASALADLLARENAALEALDVPAATALLPAKREATDAVLRTRPALAALPPDRWPAARETLARLDAEAARNRELLGRAIRVQGRVVELLARAVPPRRATYGGVAARAAHAPPVAVSLRA